jgi:hypothetical protein
MRSRLPSNLNPCNFKASLNPYCDDYEGRYSVEYEGRHFLIENRQPFALHVCEGLTGDGISERQWITNLLRLASHIHRETGRWPELSTEWAEMCPGGMIRLNITPLAATQSTAAPLPDVLAFVSSRIKKALNSPEAGFSDAERHYLSEIESLAAFSSVMRTVQREFDDAPLCVLNTNTKTRRLRFVAVAARLARTPLDVARLSTKLLRWATENESALQSHADPKGAIIAATGRASAVPYLNLAKELGVIAPVGRGLALTNSGLALALLSTTDEGFTLSVEERLFFFYELLVRDRDYICPLLILLAEAPQKKARLREAFPAIYAKHLQSLRYHCGTKRSRYMIDAALDRITRWRRAAVYMEHILDPRASWLIDLGVCTMEANAVRLTESGAKLARAFAAHERTSKFVITKTFLRQRYFKSIGEILAPPSSPPREERVPVEQLVSLLRKSCEFIRHNTQSLAPNRIVASTLFRYAGITLFAQHRMPVDFADLLTFFTDETTARLCGWKLRWQPAQDDGYLTPFK